MPGATLDLARSQMADAHDAARTDLVSRQSATRAARFSGAAVPPLQAAEFTMSGVATALAAARAKAALIR